MLKSGAAWLAVLGSAAAGASACAQESELDAVGRRTAGLVDASAEPLPEIADPGFARFVDRFASARVILLGESTHGTDEFYRARAAITERLVREHGFNVVALEADWPDAARLDTYVRGRLHLASAAKPFQRFPVWMWRNQAVRALAERLRDINAGMKDPARKAGIYGLDLYSLRSSMAAVVEFAEHHDPAALAGIRKRYGCLAAWVDDPATYGALARRAPLDSCPHDVASVFQKLLSERLAHINDDNDALFHALQNARVVAASEAYHRAMYEGDAASWNLRDTHMFETLQAVLEARGPDAKAVVWAHNSHIGDALATEMGRRGEINIGHLCRRKYGKDAVLIGFGTDRGTVSAASQWNGPTATKMVRPSIGESWGAVMRAAASDRFFLDIRNAGEPLKTELGRLRPERFIGVIYLPETERVSHYAEAALGQQFDGYVWFETTKAVEPLRAADIAGLPDTDPFAM